MDSDTPKREGELMNVVLWVVAGVLAVAFIGAGVMKLTQPKEKLAASGWLGPRTLARPRSS